MLVESPIDWTSHDQQYLGSKQSGQQVGIVMNCFASSDGIPYSMQMSIDSLRRVRWSDTEEPLDHLLELVLRLFGLE